MSAQANLTLNTQVYNPRGNISGVAKWALVDDATFGSVSDVTESVKEPVSGNRLYRIKFQLRVPKAASASNACSCEGDIISTGLATVEVVIPQNFTSSERTDFRTRIKDLVNDAVFTTAIDDLTPSW